MRSTPPPESAAPATSSTALHTLSAVEVLAGLNAGHFSSLELTDALIARIEQHDGAINALPVRRFDFARAEARAADAARAAGTGGALCGLPITIKENLGLAGTDATCGLTGQKGRVSLADGVVVAALRAAGAVVLGKSNVPQLLLAQETDSPVHGRTHNPWHLDRSPGGSSGGEAACLAAGYAPLGIGTDIGGSIRIPAHFCGIFGLKPTVDRWSNRGNASGVPGQEIVRTQVGPMARSVADLALAMRTLDPVAMGRHDPRVPPLPVPGEASVKGLRIGWYDTDGFLAPTAACRRAVAEAVTSLKAAGAVLVPMAPPDVAEITYLWLAAMSSDGGDTMTARLGNDEPIAALKPVRAMQSVPGPARKAMALVLEGLGDRRVARLLRTVGRKSVAELWQMAEQRTALRMAEFDAWNRAEVDAVVCPAHSVPAMTHGSSGDFVLGTGYLFRYSLCNFPAGVVPVSRVRAEEVAVATKGADRVERKQAEIDCAGIGLPVGVQVVARPWREDLALAVMGAVEADVRARISDFPLTPIDPRR